MFRKIFKLIKDKLFNASKKQEAPNIGTATYELNPEKPESPRTEVKVSKKLIGLTRLFKSWKESGKYKGGQFRLTRDKRRIVKNPKLKPPTKCESPDNQMTQFKDGSMGPQVRHFRAVKHQKNGKFYHKPWPFKKAVA